MRYSSKILCILVCCCTISTAHAVSMPSVNQTSADLYAEIARSEVGSTTDFAQTLHNRYTLYQRRAQSERSVVDEIINSPEQYFNLPKLQSEDIFNRQKAQNAVLTEKKSDWAACIRFAQKAASGVIGEKTNTDAFEQKEWRDE